MTATALSDAEQSNAEQSVAEQSVLRLDELPPSAAENLLQRYGLNLQTVAEGQPIPGTFWGEPEAGIIAGTVYARPDTPVHSLLHEACHLLMLTPEQRQHIHTDASGDQTNENATCYLQILLADQLPGMGRARMLADMDAWGYSFRLGSAQAWFEKDAEDARQTLVERGIVDARDDTVLICAPKSTSLNI